MRLNTTRMTTMINLPPTFDTGLSYEENRQRLVDYEEWLTCLALEMKHSAKVLKELEISQRNNERHRFRVRWMERIFFGTVFVIGYETSDIIWKILLGT